MKIFQNKQMNLNNLPQIRYNLRDASPSKSSTQNDTFKLSALSRKPINVKFKPRKSNRTNVKFDFGSDQYLKFTSESQFNKTFMESKQKFDSKMYNFSNKIGSEYGHDCIELTSNLMNNKKSFKNCYSRYRRQLQDTHFVDRNVGSATPTFALTKFNCVKKKRRWDNQIYHNQSVTDQLPGLSINNTPTYHSSSINDHLKTIVKACVLSVHSSRFLNSPSVHCFPEKLKEDKIGPLSVELKKNDELGRKIDIMKGRDHKIASHKTNSSIDSNSQESIDQKTTKKKRTYEEELQLLNL